MDLHRVDHAIDAAADEAFAFVERLVAARSTVGQEQAALQVFGERMAELGLTVSEVPVPADIGSDPRAGVPQTSYAGRPNLLARHRGPADRLSLLLNGHIDVVPADTPELWSSDPFTPHRRDGRLFGRGAGDMKAGLGMGALALQGLLAVDPDALAADLQFLAVIEEECTGNGTLAAAKAGVLADAVLVLEPTDLGLLLGGVGVAWFDVTVRGRSAHANAAHVAVNPVDLAGELVVGLRGWERQLNAAHRSGDLQAVSNPFNINVGEVHAGDWPSSVPTSARLRVRVGHPREWDTERAEQELSATVQQIVAGSGAFPYAPTIVQTGFRAAGYALPAEHPLAAAVGAAHEAAHGRAIAAYSLGSTTDARIYLNDFDTPALCYGPVAHDIHGVDESVELASIVDGAKTLARFLVRYYSWSGDPSALQQRGAP